MIKAGLNIGSSKISCIVSDYKNINDIKVLSIVSYPTSEVKKNLIVNYEKLFEETKKLLNESEKNSQTKINSINLNIPNVDSISEYYDAETIINDEKITDLHLKKLINQSNYFEKNKDYYEAINYITAYELDKKFIYSTPIGNFAHNVKIYFYRLLLNNKFVKNVLNLSNDLKLNIDNYIPSSLSSALSTLSEDEKKLGTICIDLGHSSTSTAIFENGKFIFGDSFLVGSNNITNDIARGASTTITSAERLKTLYGSVLSSPSDEHEIIEIPIISGEKNQFNQITRSTINSIIKPRVEETLEMVWQKIKQNNLHTKKIKNLVITGGGSQLEGISDYAEIIFSSNVRLAKPLESLKLESKFNNPSFADIIGTVFFEFDDFSINFMKKSVKNKKNRSFMGFLSWLDQYI